MLDSKWVKSSDVKISEVSEGVSRKILAHCKELMCVEHSFEKGAVGSVHNHPHTQITYVVSGRFIFSIGEEQKIVEKGDSMLKLNGIKHGCECLEKGVLLDVFTPLREDML